MPALTCGQGIPLAITLEEKYDILRDTLYQKPPPLPVPVVTNLTQRVPNELPYTEITHMEVSEALFSTNSNTASGPSQITYTLIKWAWPIAANLITALFQRCLNMGYYPVQWRQAVVVALRKPNKADYSQPRAYCLITLLKCLGKLLEKIVAKRLSYMVGRHELILETQFGGWSNSSTIDIAMTFVHDVHTAWNQNMVISALTFDIKGFFDFVNHQRLLSEMQKRYIPLEYLKWTANFLDKCKAAICVDGIRGSSKPVKNGIPQGSPVSPILASFYSAGLLEVFQDVNALPIPEHLKATKPTNTGILMYVDDSKLTVSSTSIASNITLLAETYKIVDQWLWKAGLTLDQDKRKIMYYTRHKKYGDPTTHIELTERDGSKTKILVTPTIQWLGIHFNRKLLFNEHVKKLSAKAEAAIGCIAMLSNTIWGLLHLNLHTLYRTCVLPIMTYASAIWWRKKEIHAKALRRVQNQVLHIICAAFRTIPTQALEVEAAIPPIHLHLDYLERKAGIRLNRLSIANPVLHRLPPAWSHSRYSTYQQSTDHPSKGTTQLLRIAVHTDHTHE